MLDQKIDITKNKLNMLYLLNSVGDAISELDLAQSMIQNDLIEYFSFMQYLLELEQASFIEKQEILGKTYYRITSRGKDALQYFHGRMMGSEREVMDRFIEKNKKILTRYKDIYADYKKISDSKYQVEIKLMEKESAFFEIKFEVPSKKISENIIDNWNKNSSKLFIDIMNIVVAKNEEESND